MVGTYLDEAGRCGVYCAGYRSGIRESLRDGTYRPIARCRRRDDYAGGGARLCQWCLQRIQGNHKRWYSYPQSFISDELDIMPVDDVVSLCELDEVVGLKYAVEDLDAFDRIVERGGAIAQRWSVVWPKIRASTIWPTAQWDSVRGWRISCPE